MKLGLFPTTKLGTEASGFSIAFLIFLWMGLQNLAPKAAFVVYSLAAAGFIMGIAALIKYKERTVFGFLPVVVGLVIIIRAIGYFAL